MRAAGSVKCLHVQYGAPPFQVIHVAVTDKRLAAPVSPNTPSNISSIADSHVPPPACVVSSIINGNQFESEVIKMINGSR